METIFFKKDTASVKYLDPFNNFAEKEIFVDIREDLITGVVSHIIPFRFKITDKVDLKPQIGKNPESTCPFCPPLFEKMTPKFCSDIIKEGKFRRGNAVLFPNAFPYDKNNAVVTFSEKHFVGLDKLMPDEMLDGFLICLDYFKRMHQLDSSLHFCSINWNYMPPAGGGLVHPHLQTIIGKNPTRFIKTIYNSAISFKEKTSSNLWKNFIAFEEEKEQRFITCTGNVTWLASFAPKGMLGEILFILNRKKSIFSLNQDDFYDLLAGFSQIFKFFHQNNISAFNLALYATLAEDDNLWVQGEIIPRFRIPPLDTSDINYFEKLHNEVICVVVPEVLCKDVQQLL